MQQHVFDDGIGSLAVLNDLREVLLEKTGQFINLGLYLLGETCLLQNVIEIVGELDRERREVVDEIERVLDFVGDACSKLAQRSKLFGLHEAILGHAPVLE